MSRAFPVAAAVLLFAGGALGQVSVVGRVLDDNGVAVPAARVSLQPAAGDSHTATADRSGVFHLELEAAGEYRIRAEHPGFFVFQGKSAAFREGENQLVITLNHLQEFAESVDVTYSPPAIDLEEPADKKQLNNVEMLTVPYPAPQDFRNALPLNLGVVQDTVGKLHFNGGATEQTNFTLNGFNLADPATGRMEARLNIESIRSLDLESARFSAEKGRGSAGSLDIGTKMGDEKFRFGGTNFVPGVSTENGLHINKWSPRVEFSGPLAKGRAWFHNGFDTFYDVDVVHGLPQGENRARGITSSNLSRFQVNVTPANILTGSFLINYADTARHGLSFLDPAETTTNLRNRLYMTTVKDQMYLGGGAIVEFGFADTRTWLTQSPQGEDLFQITPWGSRGNYFVRLSRNTYRQEYLTDVYLPRFHRRGEHQVKFGVDLERTSFDQLVDRHDYEIVREDDTVARYVTFDGNRRQRRANFEWSHYVQDRWTPRDGLLIETGLRMDWDEIVRRAMWAPRFSAVYAPLWARDTKFSAGWGVFHDALTLGTITRHQDQVSYSTFFLPDGSERSAVPTAFLVDDRNLRVPRYRTLSASVERKLPFEFYAKASYTHKTGDQGFTFVNRMHELAGGLYDLRNWRHDRYDAFEVTVRRIFGGQFEWVAGYTRSRARSDAVIDYSLENPVFAPQGPGPFPWDAPNRFLTWGWAPLPKRLVPGWLRFATRETSVAYLAEYRTGFPFSVVDDEGFLVGPANCRRYPGYFNINLHFERKFRALHYLWAWRFGFNNLTNNGNPNVVNNNIDSPQFLSYGRGQARAFAVRLRFLGKR